jgi:hypothetical protein
LFFYFDAGSNYASRSANLGQQSGTFDIAQVKIEDGSVATNSWYPYDGEFGGEISACARYYEVTSIIIATNTTSYYLGNGSYIYRSIKRTIPSTTVYTDSGIAGNFAEYNAGGSFVANRAVGFVNNSISGGAVSGTGTLTVGNFVKFYIISSAEL